MRRSKHLAILTASLATLMAAPAVADQEAFCNGYYQGYLEGYKRESGSIFEPSLPLCPLQPRRTARDPRDDFEHGYEVGYDQGRDQGRRRFR